MTHDTDIEIARSIMFAVGAPDPDVRTAARERLLAAARQPMRERSRRFPIRRARLVTVLAVLVLGGGVATAATLLSENSAALVTRGFTCHDGTPRHETGASFGILADGQPPSRACAATLHIPVTDVVVCSSARFGINVFERTGSVDQECKSAGMIAGVPLGFARAAARIDTLQRALNALYASRDCFTVAGLEAGTRTVLGRLGFTGWRVLNVTSAGVPRTGHCGQYLAGAGSWSNAAVSLNGATREVMLDSGPARSVMQTVVRACARLFAEPPTATARCTVTGLEHYVATTLRQAGASGRMLYAIYSEPRGVQMSFGNRQARYNAGCPVFVGSEMAPNGTTYLIELWQRGRPAQPTSGPPVAAYRAAPRA